jgi:uncharacterized protein (DUF433 family)
MMDAAPVQHIEIIDGQAFIKGKRLKAKLIASLHLRAGASIEEVMEQYDLSQSEVYAALSYYYDNQAAIEQSFQQAEAYVREVGISSEALKAKLKSNQR